MTILCLGSVPKWAAQSFRTRPDSLGYTLPSRKVRLIGRGQVGAGRVALTPLYVKTQG